MTWLTNTGSTASTAGSTGGSLATQTAQAAPTSVASGAIGQTGITGGMSTPAFSMFPQESAGLAKAVAHPLDTAANAAMNYLKSSYGMSGNSGTPPTKKYNPAMQGQSAATEDSTPHTFNIQGLLNTFASGRKHKPSGGGADQPMAIAPKQKIRPQAMDNEQSMQELLASLFGGQ